MSILFGTCRTEGQVVDKGDLLILGKATDRYAPDGTVLSLNGRVGMGFQPYFTHQRAHLHVEPIIDEHRNMVSVDGRIDNHADLCKLLDLPDAITSDSNLILEAFKQWGEDCFSRFIGDWALALWVQSNRSLYLARDHAGTRTLYFECSGDNILWSTHLETFFAGGGPRELDGKYARAYLTCEPIGDLTPYRGIQAVLPAHYQIFREGKCTRQPHWSWITNDKIYYRTDTEYEEHFLALFQQSVERRSGPGAAILAQLSGGMDSSSIVGTSDHLRRIHIGSNGLLDTISFYNNLEPNWNESPYFSIVESGRGKVGFHLETNFTELSFEPPAAEEGQYLFPGANRAWLNHEIRMQQLLAHRDYRVILSGIGGDELLGGVPTPLPELADYLISMRLHMLLRQGVEWCMITRAPLFHLFFETVKHAARIYAFPQIGHSPRPSWIHCCQSREHGSQRLCRALCGLRSLSLPTSINNGLAWWSIMETLPHLQPDLLKRYEYRYPYLDRNLVDFIHRIPREQILRPGQRRSLMRRALRTIVPDAILDRPRKAYLIRGPVAAIEDGRNQIEKLFARSRAQELGLLDARQFLLSLDRMLRTKETTWIHPIFRAISLELWLRSAKWSTSPVN